MTDASLWDWRRQVADLYAAIRAEPDAEAAWHHWRRTRDRLFRDHDQSPLDSPARARFQGLPVFAYDPALRFLVDLTPADGDDLRLPVGGDGEVRARPFARTRGLADRLGAELTAYWLLGYGGGVFLPFTDATSGRDTYGGGRYLLDTIKGADLGATADGRAVLDFNFAYHPSCAHSARYVCPLPSPTSRLPSPVRAGERVAACAAPPSG